MAMDRRTRSIRWRQLVALWLGSEHNLPVRERPYLVKLSEQLEEGYVPSHVAGLTSVINAHAGREFLAGSQVDRAKADAALGEVETYFSVQFRQGRGVEEALVFTNLEVLGIVLEKLRRLEELEAAT